MKTYTVEGTDRQTGQNRIASFEALNEADARQFADADGIEVDQVHESTIQRASTRVARPVDYASRGTGSLKLPDYAGLRVGGFALAVGAGLFYFAGFASLVVAVASNGTAYNVVATTSAVFTPLAAGAVFHAGSGACRALRDMARNSFR